MKIRGYWFFYGPIILTVVIYLLSLIPYEKCMSWVQEYPERLLLMLGIWMIVSLVGTATSCIEASAEECKLYCKIWKLLNPYVFLFIFTWKILIIVHTFFDEKFTVKL
jgi:hypothetical protein